MSLPRRLLLRASRSAWLADQLRHRAFFRGARAEHDNVGVCLQSYLRRTPDDVVALLPLGPAIRLVKGAYNEPASIAFPRKREVDGCYVMLADRLLQEAARGRGRPVFGTHDLPLIAGIR